MKKTITNECYRKEYQCLICNEQDWERYARRQITRLHEELHDTNTIQGNIDTVPNNICSQKRVSIK